MSESETNRRKIFLLNLKGAVRKAGKPALLMSLLGGSMPTYYNWQKVPPQRLDGRSERLATALAEYLGLAGAESLFEQISEAAMLTEDGSKSSDVQKVLFVMDELKNLRRKHTWVTIRVWVEKVKELSDMVNGDLDGLLTIIDKMKPPVREEGPATEQEDSE
jgi:hypothetical protein